MNRGKGQPSKDPYKFHPFAKKPKSAARPATKSDLARLFGGKS